ncbi:hypothetical protein QL285_017088 [Trifolium repens]|nr:hypothetical protein QL285_017088 [Trifolium repens]
MVVVVVRRGGSLPSAPPFVFSSCVFSFWFSSCSFVDPVSIDILLLFVFLPVVFVWVLFVLYPFSCFTRASIRSGLLLFLYVRFCSSFLCFTSFIFICFFPLCSAIFVFIVLFLGFGPPAVLVVVAALVLLFSGCVGVLARFRWLVRGPGSAAVVILDGVDGGADVVMGYWCMVRC